MNWLANLFAQWYENSRLLYALVTVGAMAGIGLLFALLGVWVTRKLGIDSSRIEHK